MKHYNLLRLFFSGTALKLYSFSMPQIFGALKKNILLAKSLILSVARPINSELNGSQYLQDWVFFDEMLLLL